MIGNRLSVDDILDGALIHTGVQCVDARDMKQEIRQRESVPIDAFFVRVFPMDEEDARENLVCCICEDHDGFFVAKVE